MMTDDVDAGLRLCRLSRWNQVARDWEQFLRLSPGGATVAVDQAGLVIGSVATMRYSAAPPDPMSRSAPRDNVVNQRDRPMSNALSATSHRIAGNDEPGGRDPTPRSLAWVAMVLVDPAHRGGGIGTALLERGLDSLADADAVGLDATPLGQPLYEKLGFRTASTLLRMERLADDTLGAPGPPGDGHAATSLARVGHAAATDLEAMTALDARASGLDRRAMIEWLQQGAPELAYVATTHDAIAGLVLGRHGHDFCHIGPVIAPSVEAACALVGACLRARPADRFIVDIAQARPGWRKRLEAIGFTMQRPFARMYRGEWRPAGDDTCLYAVIGPEFG